MDFQTDFFSSDEWSNQWQPIWICEEIVSVSQASEETSEVFIIELHHSVKSYIYIK